MKLPLWTKPLKKPNNLINSNNKTFKKFGNNNKNSTNNKIKTLKRISNKLKKIINLLKITNTYKKRISSLWPKNSLMKEKPMTLLWHSKLESNKKITQKLGTYWVVFTKKWTMTAARSNVY